jgi:hypothetical protein
MSNRPGSREPVRPTRAKFRTVDVRPLLQRGEEPFHKVMETVAGLGPTEGFLLVSPFLPSPLIERLQADGFVAAPERRGDGAWQTMFTRS